MRDVAVDASLATKLVFAEEYSTQTTALFGLWAQSEFQPVAPPLVIEELTNTVYKRLRRADIFLHDALDMLTALLAVDIEVRDVGPAQAVSLAHEHHLPTAYDGFYLALAQDQACEFWTADERLYNSVHQRMPWVHWIGEFQPQAHA
jgi:predicted nucleic acid-binding protein